MTTHDALLPAAVLQRKAIVYVRQSTPQQVQSNLESQRSALRFRFRVTGATFASSELGQTKTREGPARWSARPSATDISDMH